MKLVMPDTNVYGWAIAKRLYNDKRKQAINSSLLIGKLVNEKGKEKPSIRAYSCEQIENELRSEKVRKETPDIRTLHNSLILGIVKNTRKTNLLVSEYVKEFKRKKADRVDLPDLRIYACATRSRCDYLITENRKSMNRKDVVQVLSNANKRKILKVPEIVSCEKALKILFS